MAVKIRLSRTGKTHSASYRIVVQDARVKRDGAFLEILGFYNPQKTGRESFSLKEEKYKSWLGRGAKPTEGVTKLLTKLSKNG